MKKSDLKINGQKFKDRIFLMAHGAGAPMDSEWMNELTKKLVKREIQVVRFEFPYMSERRRNGKKRPPNTKKVLLETWNEVISLFGDSKVYIGGKSMGGRMASLIADESKVKGLIGLGFPFHAPGRAPGDRIEHLEKLKTKTLILQGERDSMGTKEEVETYCLSKKIKTIFLKDGDHGFKPRKKSGLDLDSNLEIAADHIAKFIR